MFRDVGYQPTVLESKSELQAPVGAWKVNKLTEVEDGMTDW